MSPILGAVHETAKGLSKAGVIDQATMRAFDRLCLSPFEPLSPTPLVQKHELYGRGLTNRPADDDGAARGRPTSRAARRSRAAARDRRLITLNIIID